MEEAKQAMDTLKQPKKTTEVRVCGKHKCNFTQERLEKFGPYEWVCPDCLEESKEAEKESYLIQNAKNHLSLPKRLQLCTFETYKPKNKEAEKAFKTCQEYVENWPSHGGGLMLGSVGTGKTHLVAAICQALCEKKVYSMMTTVNKIVRNVRSVWNGGKPDITARWHELTTESDIIDAYSSEGLLVIDEIGSQYGTESERIIVNEIINNRYEMMRPTIAIGNVSISEAKDILGERVVDRLKHDGFFLVFDWESYRR